MTDGVVYARRGWSKKPSWLLSAGLTHAELAVYDALAMHADNVSGEAWPSRARIMELAQVALPTYRKAIKSLVAAGAIEVLGGGTGRQTKRYRLINRDAPPGEKEVDPQGGSNVYPLGVRSGDPELDALELDQVEPDTSELSVSEKGGELVLFGDRLPKLGNRPSVADGFEEFWRVAVNKKATGEARKAYARAIRIADRGVVLAAWVACNQIWSRWEKPDPWRFIPMPSTWLNQQRWEDALPLENNGKGGGDSWGAVADRFQSAADDWYAAQDVVTDTYSGTTIAGTLVSEDRDTSGWG